MGKLNEQQVEALGRQAEAAGFSRRRFLLVLAGGGATAVLAACTPRVAETATPVGTRIPTTKKNRCV